MRHALALASLALATPAAADDVRDFRADDVPASGARELGPYLQCVPYARKVSGIEIYGDAHTWWAQARSLDRYTTGREPQVGAVMAFRPHRGMRLGHVAAVSKVLDERRVLLDHANWSPIDGRRGQVEKDVMAIDVSAAGDWSEVQVWYAPLGRVGTTIWPVDGFIYDSGKSTSQRVAQAELPARKESSRRFRNAFADLR